MTRGLLTAAALCAALACAAGLASTCAGQGTAPKQGAAEPAAKPQGGAAQPEGGGVKSAAAAPKVTEIKQHAAEKGLKFTILKDTGNVVADSLDAKVTPEAYLLDASGKLVYRGRIDNSRNADGVSASELRDAIEATLAGKPVEKTEVNAFGCSIKRVS